MDVGSGLAIAAVILSPFGHLSDLVHSGQPFYGFDPQNAALTEVRVERLEVPRCTALAPCACKAWSDALVAVPGDSMSSRSAGDFKAWEPWNRDDLSKVQDCDGFPCDVKLDKSETDAMKKAHKKDRLPEFLSLVDARVDRYLKTEVRTEYEFPGAPVDPWKLFEEKGFKPAVVRPQNASLFLRVLDFAPGKIQKMHQVVDRRVATQLNFSDSAVWLRDVYTDHYFDSWGEYSEVICDGEKGEAYVLLALFGEMDMLKKTGLIASITRPKLRNAFQENAKLYLNRAFERLKAAAQVTLEKARSAAAPAPAASSVPSLKLSR
jgi:hypothetical protein